MSEKKTKNKEKSNGFAIGGFIVGTISIFMHSGLSIIPLTAVVLSIIGLYQIKGTKQKGKGYAIAGIVLGVLYGIIVPIGMASILSNY